LLPRPPAPPPSVLERLTSALRFPQQQARLTPAFQAAGPEAVAGFRAVLRGIMDGEARAYLDGSGPRGKRHAG
jgi:hypothetical protein